VREGFFHAAYNVKRNPGTSGIDIDRITEILGWFDDNLEEPIKFTKSTPKGGYRRFTKGISWFNPGAVNHIKKAFEICTILKEHGYHIDVLKTDRPGYIVYEDDNQIVAEPFNDTPT